ncbi:MAG TPA: 30S ribosomal protein S6 [bacterium]|nr:30S ribosomal protein S6 [bacterium]HQG46490.1 30S ribosomal protein S6 [bacterium]HQI47268.1 30S ribosomal protein S6 [bacterium]HQJ64223.1 30S ribosomal protein S6 [bacterium]
MRKYETIIVIDSLLKLEEIEGIINKYERFISANGGRVETIDRWGKRRLAYEIKKRQYGFYVLIRFDAPPAMIKQLDREYRLNEFLLRTMTTLMEKRALKALAKQYAAAAAAAVPPAPAAEPVPAEAPADTAAEPAAETAPSAAEPVQGEAAAE